MVLVMLCCWHWVLVGTNSPVSLLAGRVSVSGAVDGPAGVALFLQPRAVCQHPATGNLLVLDQKGMVVRHIDLTTGMWKGVGGSHNCRHAAAQCACLPVQAYMLDLLTPAGLLAQPAGATGS